MAGRFEEGEAALAHVVRLAEQMSLPQTEDAVAGALITLRLWQGRGRRDRARAAGVRGRPDPDHLDRRWCSCSGPATSRRAKAHAAEHPVVLDEVDWFSMLNWACAAEAALGLGDHDLAAAAYEKLAPYAGRVASAGSGQRHADRSTRSWRMPRRPSGDRDLAARHADDALRLWRNGRSRWPRSGCATSGSVRLLSGSVSRRTGTRPPRAARSPSGRTATSSGAWTRSWRTARAGSGRAPRAAPTAPGRRRCGTRRPRRSAPSRSPPTPPA